VIYLGHLPPAFEELEILKFLSQFGKVTNIKLSRSERTGNSRGYAFVEFADNEVAAVVADTMSGYFLMGERRLVCHIVPKDKVHPNLFRGAKRNLARAKAGILPSENLKILHDKTRKQVNEQKSVKQLDKITKRLLSREKKKRELLKTLGIDYDFPGYRKSADEKNESEKKRKSSIDTSETDDIVSKKQKKLKMVQETPSKLLGKKDTTEIETKTPKKSAKKAKRSDKEQVVDATETNTGTTPSTKKAVKAKVTEQTPSKSANKSKKGDKDAMDVVEGTPKNTTGKRKVTQQEIVETPKNKSSAKKAVTEVKKRQTSTSSKKRRKSVS
jgi:RNA-binding proteins (RRM domain)